MTEDQRAEISRLAGLAHDAAQRLHMAAYQNTPRDPDEARASAVRYAILRSEDFEARGALEEAIAALAVRHGGEVRRVAEALAEAPVARSRPAYPPWPGGPTLV